MIFILLFIFSHFVTPVSADSFTETGDAVDNQYFQTVSFGIENLPDNCDFENCIEYTDTNVFGSNTELVLGTGAIETLTDFVYMRRRPAVNDVVRVPPRTKISLVYHYANKSGHDVNIPTIAVPLSRNEHTNGNIMNICDVGGNAEYGGVNVVFNSRNVLRNGYFKEYVGMGVVPMEESKRFVLDTFVVKEPVSISKIKASRNGGSVHMDVIVKNKSVELLNSLNYKHLEYTENLNLPSGGEKQLSYDIEIDQGEWYLGNISIHNPNIETECTTLGTNYYDWYSSSAVSVLAYREGEGWVNGAYVQPSVESMCIQRIPYTMYSDNLFLETSGVMMSVDSEKDVLGEEESFVQLPKTGTFKFLPLLFLLVVDAYLWYSFLKYEKRNEYTQICTKDSPDINKRGV